MSDKEIIEGMDFDVERDEKGRLKEGPIKTSEQAAALARRAHASRREKARQYAIDALAKGVSPSKILDSKEAWGIGWQDIIEAQAELAKDTSKGASSTGAARFIGQATGILEEGKEKGVKIQQGDQVIEAADVDELKKILEMTKGTQAEKW